MCYYTKITNTAEEIERHYHSPFKSDTSSFQPAEQVNGFAHPNLPVLLEDGLDIFQWGLIPFWAKDKSFQKSTLNARIETIREKPAYKQSVNNRCILIVNGFYEWKHLDNGSKEKYFIQLKDQEIFGLGCIYSIWKDQPTFSIVTKEANTLMAEIHNTKKRMPMVLDPILNQDWLTNPKIEEYEKIDVNLVAQKLG